MYNLRVQKHLFLYVTVSHKQLILLVIRFLRQYEFVEIEKQFYWYIFWAYNFLKSYIDNLNVLQFILLSLYIISQINTRNVRCF